MEPIINVENLGKKYVLRHLTSSRYVALRDVMAQKAKTIFNSPKDSPPAQEEFWALRDVSFEVGHGDRIGIIGRNGAGKSTLLKILSRIVEPTKGRVTMDGRVASLLEVGTGFHPELSGRENIFLNGAILGMNKTEIKNKFDEIVAFAEVEKFLDTPVKRYSSGMYVRLAFAVAAHLEPEILIIDEVLAVGDAEFQKKCLGKLKEISTSDGRTILFVSHNMGAIRNFCTRCIYLEKGAITADALTHEVLPLYFGLGNQTTLQGLSITATPLHESNEWVSGSMIRIDISWEKYRYAPGWHADIACYTMEGEKLFALQSHTLPGFSSEDPEANGISFDVENGGLIDRDIRLDVGVRRNVHQPYDVVIENALLLSPSNKLIAFNKINDVLLVPKVQCKAIKK